MIQNILNTQDIYQLDTLTLQEKLQQLQNSKFAHTLTNIIALVQLELSQRQKIEEWGRNLALEQHKQPIQQISTIKNTAVTSRPVKSNLTKQKQQIFLKLTQSLSNTKSYVIGKPPIKSTFDCKPSQSNKNHKKYPTNSQHKITLPVPKHNLNKNNYHSIPPPKKQVGIVNIIPTIKFQQNDVYDLNQIISTPLQLHQSNTFVDLSVNISDNNLSFTSNTIPQIIQIQSNKKEELMTNIEQSKLIQNNQQYPIKQQMKQQTKQYMKQQIKQQCKYQIKQQMKQQTKYQLKQDIKVQQTNKKKNYNNAENLVYQQAIKQKYTIQISAVKPIKELDNITTPIIYSQKIQESQIKNVKQHIINNKQKKSKSYRILSRMNHIQPNSIKQQQPQVQIIQFNAKSRINTYKKYEKIQKNLYQKYSYNNIISNFSKLFPNSKNLYTTLKVFEEGLKIHLQKNADLYALDDQYIKAMSDSLTFKIVTQTDKVRKYGMYTDLQLKEYQQRSCLMLSRIKKQQPKTNKILLYRVVRTKQDVYDIISSAFHRTSNWYELPHGLQLKNSWNLLWTWSKPQIDFSSLFYFQKVNHFLENKQIARKDLLKKNIQKIKKLGNKAKIAFDIIPQTYLLPSQNISFVKKFRQYGKTNPSNIWIMKPIGLSRGRGIQVVNKLEDIIFSQPVVLQKYICDPFLLDGYKFDMRIYVLVTSINPLQAYMYEQGFARVSTHIYSTQLQSLCDKFIHLTNFSIQKQNVSAEPTTLEQKIGGTKISLKMLKEKMSKSGIQWQFILNQIQQIIIKSLVACMNAIPQNHNSFQLFGYDIIIDSKLKCWLLQVNSSPSLEKDFILDEIIKQQLIDDTIRLLNPIYFDRKRLLEVIQRKLKQMEGLKSHINTYINSTEQLNFDLHYILHGASLSQKPNQSSNKYNYNQLAPSPKYQKIVSLVQHYKIDPIVKQIL